MHTLLALALALVVSADDASKASSAATIIFVLSVVFALGLVLLNLTRFRWCPLNHILVVFGAGVPAGQARCIPHGGFIYVMPFIQCYALLKLDPLSFDAPLNGALSKKNAPVDIRAAFIVAVCTEQDVLQNTALRLVGLSDDAIKKIAAEIITEQMHRAVAALTADEINDDPEKLAALVKENAAAELRKVCLKILKARVTKVSIGAAAQNGG
jgi:uncharacterized membrane protein YqiK